MEAAQEAIAGVAGSEQASEVIRTFLLCESGGNKLPVNYGGSPY